MTDKVRTVRLYGVLGARFGRVHRLAVNSAAEAVRALAILVPGFENFLMNSRDKGLTFAVFIGQQNLTREQLRDPPGADDIRIAPVIAGAKKAGLFSTVIGVVLMVVGAYTGQYWLTAMGAGMALGGAAQMLAPQPTGLDPSDSVSGRQSYAFNGPVNSVAQGNRVPLIYGRGIVGSVVGSAGIYAEDQL
ncbi:tail assembly protein [Pseudomonas nitroreducens]|uniref:tail assembly protein n=1 Tax=Pseudomonas nitroreducens TaxID=46680 RepID=UPI002658ABB6|nr:tail assembly protein [Pseudomonas nitroreducens]MCP1652734.1 putative phage tail protein [Pseudomonas nitroreducens]